MADIREEWHPLALRGKRPVGSPKQAKAVQKRAQIIFVGGRLRGSHPLKSDE